MLILWALALRHPCHQGTYISMIVPEDIVPLFHNPCRLLHEGSIECFGVLVMANTVSYLKVHLFLSLVGTITD